MTPTPYVLEVQTWPAAAWNAGELRRELAEQEAGAGLAVITAEALPENPRDDDCGLMLVMHVDAAELAADFGGWVVEAGARVVRAMDERHGDDGWEPVGVPVVLAHGPTAPDGPAPLGADARCARAATGARPRPRRRP